MPFSRAGRLPDDGGNPPSAETGTRGAIYSSFKSARHIDGKPRSVGWGGSRNTANRTSDGLTLAQVEGIRAAAQAAMRLGIPLNAHVTIHWERLRVSDGAAAAATGAFLTRVRDWLRKQGLPFAYAYARENGDGKGSHVHILAHLPAGADWASHRSKRWLSAIAGGFYQGGAIVTKRIGGTRYGRVTLPDLYARNLTRVVGYVTKGALPAVAAALALEQQAYGGLVIGKRAGWSENLGRLVHTAQAG